MKKNKRDWLIELRCNKELTQEDVAKKISMHVAAYANIENGTRNPSVTKAKKIAETLDFDWKIFFLD